MTQPHTQQSSPGDHRLVQSERTASRVIDGKAVVISIDQNQVHVLNSVGTRVWELCDGRPVDDIIDQIVLEFEIDREQAARDVQRFAERLVAIGAAQRSGGQG
jgi:coenzyme PQQ synthesis protein D (PqqD)